MRAERQIIAPRMRLSVQIPASALYAETIVLMLQAGTDAPLADILTRCPYPEQKLASSGRSTMTYRSPNSADGKKEGNDHDQQGFGYTNLSAQISPRCGGRHWRPRHWKFTSCLWRHGGASGKTRIIIRMVETVHSTTSAQAASTFPRLLLRHGQTRHNGGA